MTETDIPLKLIVHEFASHFAAWLLDVDKANVRRVQPLNIELPARAVRTDTVFRVTLDDGRVSLLHIEFQGRRSERPMPLRMLNYLSRLVQQEQGDLCSAVIYVGDGAGATDDGIHQVDCPGGGLTLAWRYRVVRLWQMQAEELLALGQKQPALLTLVGQTHIERPERVLPQVVAAIEQTADEEERIRLFTALLSLMRDEEMLKMVEQLAEAVSQDLMMDTPFLRRVRERGRTEGRVKGQVEGRVEGRVEELTEIILDVLATRLNLSVRVYRRLERQLSAITDEATDLAVALEQLRALLRTAIQANDVTEFERALERQTVAKSPGAE